MFLSPKKFPATFAHISIPFYIKGSDGVFIFCNTAFREMAGLTPETAIEGLNPENILWSKAPDLLWTEQEASYFRDIEKKLLEDKGFSVVSTLEIPAKGAHGSRWLKGDTMVVTGEGAEVWTLSIFQNMTPYKLAEHRARMANLRAEATSQELMEHLREANALRAHAETGSKMKSEFLANMSHEIRTPMNGVLGFSSLLLDTPLTSQQSQYVENIRMSTEALLGIINDILDISKIEAGKMDIEIISFSLRAAVEEVADILEMRIKEDAVDLITRIDPAIPLQLVGDPGRLRQILVNLAGNAIKFTEKGHVYTNISLKRKERDTVELLFEVEDTGCGIPKSKLQDVFENFTQGDASPSRKASGTGLGLAICRRLVHLMGGEIGVESIEGSGSTFWFTLPFRVDDEQKGEEIPDTDFRELRVIAVDDEPRNRQIYKELFEKWKIKLDITGTAEEALRTMKDGWKNGYPYHIGVIDYYLPGINGMELGEHLQRDHKLRDIQLIMLTSAARQGDAKVMQDAGFTAYLTKPFRAADLLETIATLWGRLRQKEDAPSGLVTRHTLEEQRARKRQQYDGTFTARILLVEDNHVNQMVASAMLKKMGCVVDLASDGLEGIQQAAFRDYDIIFMDCQMPELDGYEATEELRGREKQESGKHRTIIAMTANAMRGDREKCLKAGMDDYITKPLNEENLFAILKKWVKK